MSGCSRDMWMRAARSESAWATLNPSALESSLNHSSASGSSSTSSRWGICEGLTKWDVRTARNLRTSVHHEIALYACSVGRRGGWRAPLLHLLEAEEQKSPA